MLRVRSLSLPLSYTETDLLHALSRALRVRPSDIASHRVVKKSLDARSRSALSWVLTCDAALKGGEGNKTDLPNVSPAPQNEGALSFPRLASDTRPVVVGLGPAGLFAAYALALSGLNPIVIERGKSVDERSRDVSSFWQGGALDPQSNVQFGEGGAGAFSDGKLNTGTKDPRHRWILERFVEYGADADILIDAKPHVGTDRLFVVLQNLRAALLRLGADVRFEHRLAGSKRRAAP